MDRLKWLGKYGACLWRRKTDERRASLCADAEVARLGRAVVEQHAPSLPETRRQWFARELHRFLNYAKSRASDKVDLPLLATEYIEVLRRSEPPSF